MGKLEFATPAIYHANEFVLAALDRVQDRFLDALGISAETALIEFRLAPLRTRRDIAMLGLLQRIVLGKAPEQFNSIVIPASRPTFPRSFRDPMRRHSRQLHDPACGAEKRILQRSWLKLIYTYNVLPQTVVDSVAVNTFQKQLQNAVIRGARADARNWSRMFSLGVRSMTVATFQALFEDAEAAA